MANNDTFEAPRVICDSSGECSSPAKFRRAGFTLIELLAVVAIILVLLTLLFPMFRHVRERANLSACFSNVRQMGTAAVLSLNDREGLFWPVAWSPSDFPIFWMEQIQAYHGLSDAVRKCPSAPFSFVQKPLSSDTYWTGEYGGISWMNNGTRWHEGSYGLNSWVYSSYGGGSTLQNANYYGKLSKVQQPSLTPLFADCTWVDGWPETWEQLTPGLNGAGAHVTGGSNHTARFGLARHDRTISMGLVDGHAERVDLANLHMYNWKPTWTRHLLKVPQ